MFAALLLALVLSGCSSGGGSGSPAPVDNGTGTPPPTPTPTPTPGGSPNILLIIADDLGLDASSLYAPGAQSPITPTLDTLAADGLIFDNLWVNPTCSPTRATMLTGRYGLRTGVMKPGDILDISEESIQSYLAANAPATYRNAVIGKWHLGGGGGGANADHPNQLGVDYFAGTLGGGVNAYTNWQRTINGVTTTSTSYITTELVDLSVDWINQQTEPWFLWLAFNAPHTPFHLPPANLHTRTLSSDQASIDANPDAYYFAALEAMDSEIGRLLAAMSAEDRANTVILFIGDNGTPARVSQSPFGRNSAKGSIYQGGINTPMFASGIGVRTGEREDALINGTDFFATVAELAGIDVPTVNDSVSFADRLGDAGAPERSFAYSELINDITGAEAWSVRDTRYKLIQYDNGTQALYDLENDPYESIELITAGADVATIIQTLEGLAADIR